ncbi:MAG: hypothetical protein NC218_12235, partial [Acetobacter sp.]|nr:hypothetical protein [Acetobacter sp.]
MAKDYVLVIDIGSSKLRAVIAGTGVNDTFIVKAQAATEYDGFYEGRFLNPDAIGDNIKALLAELDYVGTKGNNKVYIG